MMGPGVEDGGGGFEVNLLNLSFLIEENVSYQIFFFEIKNNIVASQSHRSFTNI